MSSSSKPASNAPQGGDGFSIVRVLTLVIGIAAISGAGYFGWNFLQQPPVLAPFSGRVMFNGKPVTIGGVSTMRIGDNLDGAIASLDGEGRFSLKTNGEDGALVGKHKVVIASFSSGMPPNPLVPAAYTTMPTTPLVIEVTKDPAKNTVEWVLEGEVNTSPGPATSSGPQPQGDQAKATDGVDAPVAPVEESEKK